MENSNNDAQNAQTLIEIDSNPRVVLKAPTPTQQDNGNNGDSPESGSLYSDEIPSGYNSGEQYDTLSTGYMSGEAYELPDTRMEIREPALDVIEECLVPLDSANDDSDAAAIFMLPKVKSADKLERDNVSMNSTSTDSSNADAGTFRNVPIDHHTTNADGMPTRSPKVGVVKSKLRKNVTTCAIPIEITPSGGESLPMQESYAFDPESSDANCAPTGGYRAVPSDTDTSAFDSDANAIIGVNSSSQLTDSGAELLHASVRTKTKADRIAGRKAKRMRRHDEEWFNAHDNKYWAALRQTCFWLSILAMVTSSVVAGVLIYYMPRKCDPQHEWYQGTVFMDMAPKRMLENSTTNHNYLFNIEDAIKKLPVIKGLGIRAIHLRELMAIPNGSNLTQYYPSKLYKEKYQSVFGMKESDLQLGLKRFVSKIHEHNLTVLVQIPLMEDQEQASDDLLSVDLQYFVSKAIEFWAKLGVDGIFLDGLENFASDDFVARSISSWNTTFEKYGTTNNKKILMTSYLFAQNLFNAGNKLSIEAMSHIGLLDATVDMTNNDYEAIFDQIANITVWDAIDGRPWINWNLKFIRSLPLTKAALAFQFLLPGTISVSELIIESDNFAVNLDSQKGFKLADQSSIRNLTSIRTVAVPIYMNGNYKRCDCDESGFEKEINYSMQIHAKAILQLERFYSRRNRYLLVANFGDEDQNPSSLQEVGKIYSYGELIFDTNQLQALNSQVNIRELELNPGHAIVIKLPK